MIANGHYDGSAGYYGNNDCQENVVGTHEEEDLVGSHFFDEANDFAEEEISLPSINHGSGVDPRDPRGGRMHLQSTVQRYYAPVDQLEQPQMQYNNSEEAKNDKLDPKEEEAVDVNQIVLEDANQRQNVTSPH